MFLVGKGHPPEYLLPSVLGYRVLELVIKPHCIVRMMGVWLHRALGFEGFFFTYMYTCHKSRELEKRMDGIISWGKLSDLSYASS